jgi:uncharacterized protein YneF (UPF0154 family)
LASTVDAQEGLLFGQTHSYSVLFRGNGEAIVYVKIVVTNSEEEPMDEISFEIPSVSPSELAIYQIKLPQECVQYDYRPDGRRYCVEYRDPDYTEKYWYYGYDRGEAEYSKLEYSDSGQLYEVKLAEAVAPYNTTAVVVAYAARGYVKNTLGLYKYDFETIKVSSRIQEVTIAINVDSELYLKGKKSEVNYSSEFKMDTMLSESSTPITNRNLDNLVRGIGSGGQIIKNAENLAPGESFTVKGEYAKSWFRLYLGSIVIVILIIIGIFVGVYYLSKYLKKRKEDSVKNSKEEIKDTTMIIHKDDSVAFFSILHLGVGLLSLVLTVGLTFLIVFLEGSDFTYEWYSSSPIIEVLIIITIILLYFLTIFGPAIFVAIKRGWKSFLAIIVMAALWAIFLTVVLSIFLNAFSSSSSSSYEYRDLPILH